MNDSATALLGRPDLPLLQGWQRGDCDRLVEAWAEAGGAAVVRLPAFPDATELRARLQRLRERTSGVLGLDVKGVMGHFREVLEAATEARIAFLLHGPRVPEGLRQALEGLTLPRWALAGTEAEAREALAGSPQGLILEPGAIGRWLEDFRRQCTLPILASLDRCRANCLERLDQTFAGFRLRSPRAVREGEGLLAEFRRRLGRTPGAAELIEPAADPLPRLRIRDLDLPYPILQGGMGVGVSWAHLAGSAAHSGCVGLVSAIGTAYANLDGIPLLQGRPIASDNVNHGPNLKQIIRDALAGAQGRGAVGVNILCAIQGYDRVVRESIEAGARLVVSGAGLPMNLPELAAGSEAALVPIVSSARALRLLCRTWERRHGRLPDAVILEGPESGGHQGYNLEQCVDPAFTLEALLPEVLAERDRWGAFPVIVAGGIWNRADIVRFLALGAGGVQMGTRFVGTLECDAAPYYKEVLLRARKEDIQLMKSPVGMPARAVRNRFTEDLARGQAPPVRCISQCLTPCGNGQGAREAGYCIADRLADSRAGEEATGLFFSGSNGWRLRDLVSVRELVEELTGDFGLERMDTEA